MEESRYQSNHEHDNHEHHHDHDQKNDHYEHHHDHDHNHGHDHHEHHHDHEHEGNAPDKRLYALMNYMLSHNADHTKELEQLALKVKESGNDEAYEHTVEAVRLFSEGNDALKKALEHMENK